MARKNDGACGNSKLIMTDVDCRAARPKFNEGAWSPSPSAESLATDDVGRKLAGPRATIDSLNSWTGALGQPMPRYVIYSFA
jgi:hypothetical protein